MASLSARHVRTCALGKPWTPAEGATEGCTCPEGPVYHVVMWKDGGQTREHAGHDLDAANELLARRIDERAARRAAEKAEKAAKLKSKRAKTRRDEPRLFDVEEGEGAAGETGGDAVEAVAPVSPAAAPEPAAPVLESPAGGTVRGVIRLRARDGSSGWPAVSFEVAQGGNAWQSVGEVLPSNGIAELDWDTTAAADGPLLLRSVSGGRASQEVWVAVDNNAPLVRVTSPAAGDPLTDPLLVYAAASDAGSGVRAVRLLVSLGGEWEEIATVDDPPYVGVWTPPAGATQAWLVAVAWDSSGHQGTSAVVGVGGGAAAAAGAAAAGSRAATGARTTGLGGGGRIVTLGQLRALLAQSSGEQAARLEAVIAAVAPYASADGVVPDDFSVVLEEFGGLGTG